MAPLRADLLSGHTFYVLWSAAVDVGSLRDEEPEPLPGIGPPTGCLEAPAGFFRIDSDLVRAAAEMSPGMVGDGSSSETVRRAISSIPEDGKTDLTHRFAAGDIHVVVEVWSRVRQGVWREVRASGVRSRRVPVASSIPVSVSVAAGGLARLIVGRSEGGASDGNPS